MIYQSIILGISAAGISAGIYLKRRGVNFIMIGRDIGGELSLSGIVENYPGFLKINGLELAKKFKQHLDYYKISYFLETVEGIEKINHIFKVKTNKNYYESKSIIIATGTQPKKLNIPGEKKFYHKGLSYCSVCDLPLFKNRIVAIVGGGNSALEAGLMASDICKMAYIINKNPKFKGDDILINELNKKNNVKIIYNSLTKEIYGDKFVKGLKYLNTENNKLEELNIDGVFIHIGLKPNSEFIPNSWEIKNNFGEIVINELGETKINGCFAAGDVTNIPYKQIGIAVGQGIIAALSNIKFLNNSS
ncbi:MAG: thioredoxin-disulfide reductase [Candidatus Parcubacteria bacterium]|nr:MAG: thioredoxin-disulfide reductase [Candidatus Parcubacteria bacterium]